MSRPGSVTRNDVPLAKTGDAARSASAPPEPGPHAAGASAAAGVGPLSGRRILLPRAKPDDAIAAELSAAGAEVVRVGVTRSVPGPVEPREHAARDLAAGEYAWVVLTSARTLEFFDLSFFGGGEEAAECGDASAAAHAPSSPRRSAAGRADSGTPTAVSAARGLTRIAVVGEATARAVRERLGREPDLVAAGSGAALLDLPRLTRGPATNRRRLLLPGSALASPKLAAGLAAVGWEVDAVAAYTMEPVPAGELPGGLAADWASGGFDAVVLVAGSSTRALVEAAGPPAPATRVVAIGRPTAAAARAVGLGVDAVAASPTPGDIRAAILTLLPTDLRRPAP